MTANRSTVGALRVVLGIDTAAFDGGLTKAQSHLRRVGRQMERVGRQMRTVGLALSAAVVGATAAAGAAVTKLSGQILDLKAEAETAGVSFEKFQELKYIADANRVSLAALTDGFKELQLRADEWITTGTGSAAEVFERLGYSAADLREKLNDPVALFDDLIERMGRFDTAAQIRIADELFGGTGGEQFVRLLAEGTEGFRRLRAEFARSGNLITPEQVARARALDAAVRRLREVVQNLGRALIDSGVAVWLTGAIRRVAEFGQGLVQAVPWLVKWGALIGGLALAVGGLLTVMGTMVAATGALIVPFAKLAAAVTAAGGALAGLKAAGAFLIGNPWILAITALVTALGLLVVGFIESAAEARAYADAVSESDRIIREMDEAARSAADGTAAFGDANAAAIDPTNQLCDATAALADETYRLADAQAQALRTSALQQIEANRRQAENLRNPGIGERVYESLIASMVRRRLVIAGAGREAMASALEEENAQLMSRIIDQWASGREQMVRVQPRASGGGGAGAGSSSSDAGRIADLRERLALERRLAEVRATGDAEAIRAEERRQRLIEITARYLEAGYADAAIRAEDLLRLDEQALAVERGREAAARAREEVERRLLDLAERRAAKIEEEQGRSKDAAMDRREGFARSFSDGVMAAFNGDLGAFLEHHFQSIMSGVFDGLGRHLYDRVFGAFDAVAEGTAQGTAQGAAAAPAILSAGQAAAAAMGAAITAAGLRVATVMNGASVAGGLGKVGSILSGLPKFSGGGAILPSGASGLDSQLIAFWKSPREQVSIGTPGQLAGAAGGRQHVHVTVGVNDDRFNAYVDGRASVIATDRAARSVQASRNLVPAEMAQRERRRLR